MNLRMIACTLVLAMGAVFAAPPAKADIIVGRELIMDGYYYACMNQCVLKWSPAVNKFYVVDRDAGWVLRLPAQIYLDPAQ